MDDNKAYDTVARPAHYADCTIQPIQFIAAQGMAVDFLKANAIKYITRAGRKPGNDAQQDIAKAIMCLRFLIAYYKHGELSDEIMTELGAR